MVCVSTSIAQSAFAIKKWSGRYPRMNNDYPLAFVSWKGWLPPVPHFFVRLYPSHYYYYLNGIPAYDVKSYVDMGLYNGLKLVLKNIDEAALKASMEAISDIQQNQLAHENIEDYLRQSRLTPLTDVYQTSKLFAQVIQALEQLKQQNGPTAIHEGFERDIRYYLEELLLIKQLDASQGDKLKAMSDLNQGVRQLIGTIHYTQSKLRSYRQQNTDWMAGLSFLGSL